MVCLKYRHLTKLVAVTLNRFGDMSEVEDSGKPISTTSVKIGNYASDNQLSYPGKKSGTYQNPWSTWKIHDTWATLRFLKIYVKDISPTKTGVPTRLEDLDAALPVVKPDFGSDALNSYSPPRVCWIGHATIVLQLDGINILTDPIFSDRCSPVQWIGSKRIRPVPCRIEQLPKIDAVVISHNHFDHLDLESVVKLNARFGDSLRWYVPEGMKSWMEARRCRNVVEMTWWDENQLPGTEVTFAFTPSQHWSKRGVWDYCSQLWGSWSIIGPRHRVFFGGDTGYCEVFKQIGAVYGPFDVAAIPIGAYNPRWFMQYAHVQPEESVKIHQDIKAKKSVAIHWGTFVLTTEHYLDPPIHLKKALAEANILEEDFLTLKHGETFYAASSNAEK